MKVGKIRPDVTELAGTKHRREPRIRLRSQDDQVNTFNFCVNGNVGRPGHLFAEANWIEARL